MQSETQFEIWNSNWTNIRNLRPSHVWTAHCSPQTSFLFPSWIFYSFLFNNFHEILWKDSHKKYQPYPICPCFVAFIKEIWNSEKRNTKNLRVLQFAPRPSFPCFSVASVRGSCATTPFCSGQGSQATQWSWDQSVTLRSYCGEKFQSWDILQIVLLLFVWYVGLVMWT